MDLSIILRTSLLVIGLVCAILAHSAFRRTLKANADLRLKLGREFVRSVWDLVPGVVLAGLGVLAVAVAYFCPPNI